MKRLQWAIAALFCFTLAAVAQDVTYNFDQSADFSKFRTYKWVRIGEGNMHPDQLVDQQIRGAIDAELAKKGLTKTEDDKATLYIGYQLAVGQERQVNSYSTGGYGWGYGARGRRNADHISHHFDNQHRDPRPRYVNPDPKQLVWRGKASKTLDDNAKPEKRQKNLAKAMQKMLKNYPPPVKK